MDGNQPFCLFENVRTLAAQDGGNAATDLAERDVGAQLRLHVRHMDSGTAGLSEAFRKRVYWTNIRDPTPEAAEVALTLASETASLLQGKPSFDPRTSLNCLTTKEGTEHMNRINVVLDRHYAKCDAEGLMRDPPAPQISADDWKRIKESNLLFSKVERSGAWQLRMLETKERCRLMGFPEDCEQSRARPVFCRLSDRCCAQGASLSQQRRLRRC